MPSSSLPSSPKITIAVPYPAIAHPLPLTLSSRLRRHPNSSQVCSGIETQIVRPPEPSAWAPARLSSAFRANRSWPFGSSAQPNRICAPQGSHSAILKSPTAHTSFPVPPSGAFFPALLNTALSHWPRPLICSPHKAFRVDGSESAVRGTCCLPGSTTFSAAPLELECRPGCHYSA